MPRKPVRDPQKPRKLTPREKDFVEAYVAIPNATQAAIKSGSPAASASSRGYELLSKKHIQKAIEEGFCAKSKRNELNADDILRELKFLAYLDPRKLFNPDGSPIPIQDLDEMTAKAIAGVEVAEIFEGFGQDRVFVGYLKKYKLVDKLAAVDKVMRYLGLFHKDNKQKATLTLEQLVAPEGEKEK